MITFIEDSTIGDGKSEVSREIRLVDDYLFGDSPKFNPGSENP